MGVKKLHSGKIKECELFYEINSQNLGTYMEEVEVELLMKPLKFGGGIYSSEVNPHSYSRSVDFIKDGLDIIKKQVGGERLTYEKKEFNEGVCPNCDYLDNPDLIYLEEKTNSPKAVVDKEKFKRMVLSSVEPNFRNLDGTTEENIEDLEERLQYAQFDEGIPEWR